MDHISKLILLYPKNNHQHQHIFLIIFCIQLLTIHILFDIVSIIFFKIFTNFYVIKILATIINNYES